MKFKVDAMSPTDVFPIEGYEAPKDFPNCCPCHTKAFEDANSWFAKFPDCCNSHREMAEKGLIKKEDFEGLPRKILDCLSFTEYHISTQIEIPEWYEDITNYIDYIWWSFGKPPIGLHLYFNFLKDWLKTQKGKIPKEKIDRLIDYIEDYNKPVNEVSSFDLNVLYDTLQKWVKTFPFELPYFKGLKAHFEGKIPAFKEPARVNPYTRMAKAKALTQAELIDALDVTTKRLLGEVQADKMFAEGQILDISKHRLELANESLKVGTAKLVRDYSKGELRYVTTLKKWLELQKTYFNEVVVIMGQQSAAPTMSKGKEARQPAPPVRTFQSLFKDIPSMERLLTAAVSIGLITQDGDGYTWIDEGAKSHRVCALWFAAVDAGITKAKLKNNEATTKAIKEFFGMGTLSKDTIEKANRYHSEYRSIKSALEKKLRE